MRELLCVILKASVLELAKVMVEWSVSSVAITDEENNKKVIGILTERHIVKSIAKGAFLITEPFLLVPL
jgi:predicted transcriptional regulator